MIIDVWSDVVCPWCFIGKRRLEKALEQFGHKEDVVIRHRAFQLQPDAKETVSTKKHLAEKYRVSPEQVKEMQANVCAVADGEDLCTVAQSVGIPADDVKNLLASRQFTNEVIADRDLASQLGATGVPFFVVDMKFGISGAQPLEAFVQTLETAWSQRA